MSKSEPELFAHSHSHSEVDVPISSHHRKILLSLVVAVLIVMAIGIVMTWPSSSAVSKAGKQVRKVVDFANAQYPAHVDNIKTKTCEGQDGIAKKNRNVCEYVLFDIEKRTVKSSEGVPCIKDQPFLQNAKKPLRYCVQQSFDPASRTTPKLSQGQNVVVAYRNTTDVGDQFHYSYADQDRRGVLIFVFILFLIAVIAFGAWRGLFAVLGLIASLVIIAVYILPALVTGENGLIVALSGGTAVAAAGLYLARGIHNSTHIAFLSSIGSVLSIAFLAELFFALGHFTGLVSEEANYLAIAGSHIDMRGLLVAGVILATLGALDDMTVTQVSAVSEMHNARPDYRFSQLWKSGVRIGRDHVASTVNMLALAYVGTTVAVMVLFVVSQQSLQWIANSEAVAVEIIGALVGSVGIVVSVPFATALAAYIVHRSGEHDHDHEHGEHDDKDSDHDHSEHSHTHD